MSSRAVRLMCHGIVIGITSRGKTDNSLTRLSVGGRVECGDNGCEKDMAMCAPSLLDRYRPECR